MIAGTCQYCGCTEEAGCTVGCAWTDDTQTLCTACLSAEQLAEMFVRILTDAKKSARPPIQLVTAAWSALTFEQKQLLVMTVRAITEQITRHVATDLLNDSREDLLELDAIASFLLGAGELKENESISVTVQRLLAPHVGRRVVLAGRH